MHHPRLLGAGGGEQHGALGVAVGVADVDLQQAAVELVELAGDVPASRAALGLSIRQDEEVARNAGLWTSATQPALHR